MRLNVDAATEVSPCHYKARAVLGSGMNRQTDVTDGQTDWCPMSESFDH